MSEKAPYSRVYWSIGYDEKFDGVRHDARLVGTWLLLLVAADMAYPSPAYLLPNVRKTDVNQLVKAGLVDFVDSHRYRIHGLDAERTRRAEAGRIGGSASAQSRTTGEQTLNERSPNVPQTSDKRPTNVQRLVNETKAETKAETKTETKALHGAVDALVTWMELTGTGRPSSKVRDWVDGLSGKYGEPEVDRAIREAFSDDPDRLTLIGRAEARLVIAAREADRRELADERKRNATKREPVPVQPLPAGDPEEVERAIAAYRAEVAAT